MSTADWSAPALPPLEIHWTCAVCHVDEKYGRTGHCVTRPGDEDDVVLCDVHHTPENIEIAGTGKPYDLSDGTPTYLLGDAVIDGTLAYRYRLRRRWLGRERGVGPILWLMLNPSTADAHVPDPTITRIIGFTHRWGGLELEVGNLFAYRTPHPSAIPNDMALAVGVDNDRHLFEAMKRASRVVVGWGKPSGRQLVRMVDDRIAQVRAIAAAVGCDLFALVVNPDGSPRHPLARGTHRIPDDTSPVPWVSRG